MGAHYELWPDLLHWPGSAEEGVGTHNREEPGGTLQPVKDTTVLRANQEKEAEPKESHRQHGSKATLAEVLLKMRTAAANPNGIGCTEVRGCPVSILLSASLVVFVSRHQIFPLVHPHCRPKLEEDWGLHPRGAVSQQSLQRLRAPGNGGFPPVQLCRRTGCKAERKQGEVIYT